MKRQRGIEEGLFTQNNNKKACRRRPKKANETRTNKQGHVAAEILPWNNQE